MAKPFLLEIGTEEVPDWMIPPALENLRNLFQKLLADNGLAGEVTRMDATPRHLVLRAEGLPLKQKSKTEVVIGPPVSAGEKAAEGFARKQGAGLADLKTVKTPKGEYYSNKRKVEGRQTVDILAEALPDLILKIHFPKTMYWTGKGGTRFIRPIRWIVALFGSKIVPFEIAGVQAGKYSSGHRRLGKKRFAVTVVNHEEQLEKNYVILSADKRRQKILDGIDALLAGKGLTLKSDPALLETLTYLTECPTPILGSFDQSYLALPAEVLTTVMRHHQKYFSVLTGDGKLAPHFVAVMNTSADPDGLVRSGNERVLRARFNDARFFWEFDQNKKLADRVQDLAHVTFQKELGSYREKADRMVALVADLGGTGVPQRAAVLAKCDLTTEMVGEFPELQGIVGGLYANAQGEPDDVAEAIYHHYKPTSMEDEIPSTADGCLVALADKLDTLRECFRIGMIPTGSKDPFALRRAAQGVVKILVEGDMDLPLGHLVGDNAQLREFLLDRVSYYFREIRGYAYDEVNAVLATGCENLPDVGRRLKALREVRPTDDFEPIAASFKRIKNILRQAEFSDGGSVDPERLEAGAESELHAEASRIGAKVAGLRRDGDYGAALLAIASLRPAVDRFFDHVMVNVPDEQVRRNRLALLDGLLHEFSSIADFSEIVTTRS